MSFYDDIEMGLQVCEVYGAYLGLIAEDDPFFLAVQVININDYQFTSNLRYQFGISEFKSWRYNRV